MVYTYQPTDLFDQARHYLCLPPWFPVYENERVSPCMRMYISWVMSCRTCMTYKYVPTH